MIRINNPSTCCGCTACEAICPKSAIRMKRDALGFLYPEVDESICVECGACEKVCAFNERYDRSLNLKEPVAFAVRHKDKHEIETSRSGAAFIALSDWILGNNGVVYGAGYGNHFRVTHKRATTKEERNEFKGSKYAQSEVSGIFRQVKADLKEGKIVLFSGTPCQTAALNAFIGKKGRTNLYLIDIICHGVSSPSVWEDYLTYLEKKTKRRITAVNFRDKEKYGWSGLHKETFRLENRTEKYTYSYTYYSDLLIRYSCNSCPFTNCQRPSDITLGDFWGWERISNDFNADGKGCSLILCNTEKGKDWFATIKEDVHFIPAKLEDCMQPNLQRPTPINPQRAAFEQDYRTRGFVYVMHKYGEVGLKYQINRCTRFAQRMLNKIMKVK